MNTTSPNCLVTRMSLAAGLLCLVAGGQVFAGQKAGNRSESGIELPMSAQALPQTEPPRVVEVVIIRAFRLRANESDRRRTAVEQGYSELVKRDECISKLCAFIVVPDGASWRYSNVLAGSESELLRYQQNMELAGTTMVLVHPTGERRVVPRIEFDPVEVSIPSADNTRQRRRPR